MAEITFRIPSKAVTYGYVEIPVTLTDDPAPEALASMYVNYVYAFQKEEQAALKRIAEQPPAAPEEAAPRDSTTDTHEAAVEAIRDGLGATEMEGDVPATGVSAAIEQAAPWDKAVDSKPKPWEIENLPPEAVVTSPAVLDAAW